MTVSRAAIVGVLVFAFGCNRDDPIPTTGSPITIIVTTTTGGPTQPSPSPGTGPGSGCPNIPRMRVGIFGFRQGCANPPRNGQGILPLDCIADVTATPIGLDGNPVPSTVHGFNIQWSAFSSGAGRLRLIEDSDNPFNRAAVPEAVGDVTMSAVLTPPGCSSAVVGEATVRIVAAGVRQ